MQNQCFTQDSRFVHRLRKLHPDYPGKRITGIRIRIRHDNFSKVINDAAFMIATATRGFYSLLCSTATHQP
ncbi:hypothetical protein AHF37_09576 [Paragonimus kellicotti]|nr:hypothetical protein AHF37_09576 [Paragonimus kellicotti]